MRVLFTVLLFLLISTNVYAFNLQLNTFDADTKKTLTSDITRVTIQGFSGYAVVALNTNHSSCSITFHGDHSQAFLLYQQISSLLKKKMIVNCAGKDYSTQSSSRMQVGVIINPAEKIMNNYYSISDN
ncbi:MAG: hypothetical protein JXR79_04865 [Nitrospirae bacterium]|nr:hypothetical protein [Nitrospirota bacterium]